MIKFDSGEEQKPRKRIEANASRGRIGRSFNSPPPGPCPCQPPSPTPQPRIDKAAAGRKILGSMAMAAAHLENEIEEDTAEIERLDRTRPKVSPAPPRPPSRSKPSPVAKVKTKGRNAMTDENQWKEKFKSEYERPPTSREIDEFRRRQELDRHAREDFVPNLYNGPGATPFVPPEPPAFKDSRPVPPSQEAKQELEARRGWMPSLFKHPGGPPLLPPELTAKPAPPADAEEEEEDEDEPEEKPESEGERLMRVFQEKLKETKDLIREQDEARALRGGR